ncbi:hypothetical protein J4E80_009456 [Alternaria sp. BMP 0032]|nr:hypothetical protein J4E80_009456 [Alternaria sp. BMP 0032]
MAIQQMLCSGNNKRCSLYWAWRKKADRPFLRSILLVLIAMLFAAITITASIFSSLIVDTGTVTVMVDSPSCGQVNVTGTVWRPYGQLIDRAASAYTRECYRDGPLPPACNVFTQPNIPLNVENVPCPFNDTMCDTKDAVRIDSGLIDVSKTFGLNLAAQDRVSFRKKTECTVLPVEGYYDVVDLEERPMWKPDYREILPGEQVAVFFYGPRTPLETGESYIVHLIARGIVPINPEEAESDIILKQFFGGSLSFEKPINDPLYSSHKEYEKVDFSTGETSIRYQADHPSKAVACTQNLQYCHARDGKDDWCTPMEGVPHPLHIEQDFPEANEVQRAILELLIRSTWLHPTSDVLSCKVNTMISLNEFTVRDIPDDFWKQEVLGWEQETWGALQVMVSRHAIGPEEGDPLADGYRIEPKTEGEWTLCGAQKMKKTGGFVNINVFGLSFIIAFSVLVAIIDITLLKFLVYLTRFRRALGPRIARWTQDGVWQLQRRAYEGEGHRNWTDLESEIPLMEKGHKLKDLPIMWRPGKSPMMAQATSFASTNSIVSEQQSVSELAAEDVETAPVVTEPRRGWFSFARR